MTSGVVKIFTAFTLAATTVATVTYPSMAQDSTSQTAPPTAPAAAPPQGSAAPSAQQQNGRRGRLFRRPRGPRAMLRRALMKSMKKKKSAPGAASQPVTNPSAH